MTETMSFPDWAPQELCMGLIENSLSDDTEVNDMVNHLLTYPEMKHVWSSLREWMKTSYNKRDRYMDGSIVEFTVHVELLDYATLAIGREKKPAVISNRRRKQALLEISKHAKQLRNGLRSLGMPTNLLWYLPRQDVYDFIEQSVFSVYDGMFGESFIDAIDERHPPPPGDTSNRGIFDFAVGAIADSAKSLPSRWGKEKTYFSIYELMETLSDEELMAFPLPPVYVQRAKFGNENRLLLIRSTATHIHDRYKRDASEEREFLSAFARTVLDDDEINEDTVKDALRGYEVSKQENHLGIT